MRCKKKRALTKVAIIFLILFAIGISIAVPILYNKTTLVTTPSFSEEVRTSTEKSTTSMTNPVTAGLITAPESTLAPSTSSESTVAASTAGKSTVAETSAALIRETSIALTTEKRFSSAPLVS